VLHVLLTRCRKSKFDATGDHPQNRGMATEALIPTTPEEAARLFGDGSSDLTVFAGGTILLPEIASGRLRPTRALMLHRSGLDTLATSGDVVRIGATTTIAALIDGTDDLLTNFAEHVGDGEVRRTATVGGNLCATPGIGAQRGDLGAPLIALGARVTSTGKGGERTEPVEDFISGDRAGRLVLSIEYDRPGGKTAAEMMRRRHAHSYAVVIVAIAEVGGGIRVGISGVGPFAVRGRSVEQSRKAADVLHDVEPVGDALASAAYRRKMLPLLVQRALDQLESA
jgi:carbon-monoxide dehydrogenase medium subunit